MKKIKIEYYVILLYALINIVFARVFWSELFFDSATTGAVFGEILATEWNMEKVYQNLIQGRNPFAGTLDMLYPFGSNYISTDSGNGFLFLLTRPFLSAHQSFYILSALALFFANIGMFFLLRKLNIRYSIACVIGLAFGYMTFIHPRIGHLSYLYFYTFPWFYYAVLSVLSSDTRPKKIWWSTVSGLLFVFTLYLNLYFFVSLALSVAFFCLYFLLFDRHRLFHLAYTHIAYLLLFGISSLVFLSPWLLVLWETARFEELPTTQGWGGAIEFSSDLFGYFVPSIYSYFMSPITHFIGRYAQFTIGIFENFSYPGIIILGGLVVLAFYYFRKKLSENVVKKIAPFLFGAAGFWILTLGPFLHVAGRWAITVEENIKIVFPLPFVLFHYLPFMANIRSPGRLVAMWIFLSYIVIAILFDYILKHKSRTFVRNAIIVLALIFVIDHYFLIPTFPPNPLPYKLYETIRQDKRPVSVMELPFVVRDGFTYFGDVSALDFITGQQDHGKSVIGGYMGRVPHFKREYYVRNPLLGYFGRLIDPDIRNNGSLPRSDADLLPWKTLKEEEAQDVVDFLDIAYVLVKQDTPYVSTAEADLQMLGFEPMKSENDHELWYRKPARREFRTVQLGKPGDEMYLGSGWNTPDSGFRWAGEKTEVLFKVVDSHPRRITFTAASFHESRHVQIFVDRQYVQSIELGTSLKEYNVKLKDTLSSGMHSVHFLFDGYAVPAQVISGSFDMRQISAKFTQISLQ